MTVRKGTLGNDTIDGTPQTDTLFGAFGNDLLNSLAGRDALYGGDGDDRLFGGDDRDYLGGGVGRDTLTGGDGDDLLQGDGGFAAFSRDTVRDVLVGGAGDDQGDMGINDVFVGGPGDDFVIFDFTPAGEHVLKLDFSHIGSATPVALGPRGSLFASTEVASAERVEAFLSGALPGSTLTGSAGDDRLFLFIGDAAPGTKGAIVNGGAGNDELDDTGRNDSLSGGSGDDRIDSDGRGADTFSGGNGDDVFVYSLSPDDSSAPSPDTITDFATAHDLFLIASQGTGFDFGDQKSLLLNTTSTGDGTTPDGIAQFLYNRNTGQLFLDVDGVGAEHSELFATLTTKPALLDRNILIETADVVVV